MTHCRYATCRRDMASRSTLITIWLFRRVSSGAARKTTAHNMYETSGAAHMVGALKK